MNFHDFPCKKGAKRFIALVVSSKISTHFIAPTIGLCETDELAEIVGFFNKLDSAFGGKKGWLVHMVTGPQKNCIQNPSSRIGLFIQLQPLMCELKFAKVGDLRLVLFAVP